MFTFYSVTRAFVVLCILFLLKSADWQEYTPHAFNKLDKLNLLKCSVYFGSYF